jgi:hypothetical protein
MTASIAGRHSFARVWLVAVSRPMTTMIITATSEAGRTRAS